MSKLISEYNTLGYFHTKERAYKLGKIVMLILSIISFIVLFAFAPSIAHAIIGDATGGNSIEDITFVVRVISTAILFVPLLSVSKGYLQGHKFISPSSFSQILEQVIRIIVILVGSYTFLNIFNLGMTNAIGIAVFGATIGAIAALCYILHKIHKNKDQLNTTSEQTEEEKKITNKDILKKILGYSLPFIMFGLTMSVYQFVDMLTVVKTMTNTLGYTIDAAESVIGVLNTWGAKLNNIIIAISTGLTTSLVPNITSSFVAKKYDDVRRKVNQSIQILLFIGLPIAVGLSILANPVFNAFYGANTWGPIVFRYSVFIAVGTCLFNTTIIILQSLSKYKAVFISLFSGAIAKLILNIPLMNLTHTLGLEGFYGAITATLIGLIISITINLIVLNKTMKVNYSNTFKSLLKIILSVLVMCIVIFLLHLFIPMYSDSRVISIIIVSIYGILGGLTYFILTYKTKVINDIFGKKLLDTIKSKFIKRQKTTNQ